MKILFETEKLILEGEYELAKLISKENGEILLEEFFYGEPSCGLIAENCSWAIVAGVHSVIWKPHQIHVIEDSNLKWIHSMRVKGDGIVELLTDPWSDSSAIWEINITTLQFKKIKDFKNYKGKDYTDNVIW